MIYSRTSWAVACYFFAALFCTCTRTEEPYLEYSIDSLPYLVKVAIQMRHHHDWCFVFAQMMWAYHCVLPAIYAKYLPTHRVVHRWLQLWDEHHQSCIDHKRMGSLWEHLHIISSLDVVVGTFAWETRLVFDWKECRASLWVTQDMRAHRSHLE